MKRTAVFLLIIGVWLGTAVPLLAQANETTGTVAGQIVNETTEGETPGNLELMLHAWDDSFAEKLMLNEQADTNGAFRFEDVTFNSEWLYAVMLTYNDILYFSEPTPLVEDQTTLNIEIPVYEVTTDTSLVQIERQHIFFTAAPDGLQVGEIYILSNLGNKTIAGISGEDNPITPLQFSLPEGATNVTFTGSEDGRYLTTPTGFADTAPLRPGVGQSQVVVQYVLPYADSLTYALTAQWPVAGVNFLIPDDIGLSISGENLVDEGVQEMEDGTQVGVFTHEALAPGDSLSVNLEGALVVPAMSPPAAAVPTEPVESANTQQQSLALGGVLLGMALVGVGVWWYRRPNEEDESAHREIQDEEFDDLVIQIAKLDEAHDLGEIDDETYQLQRTALRQQAMTTLRSVNPA